MQQHHSDRRCRTGATAFARRRTSQTRGRLVAVFDELIKFAESVIAQRLREARARAGPQCLLSESNAAYSKGRSATSLVTGPLLCGDYGELTGQRLGLTGEDEFLL